MLKWRSYSRKSNYFQYWSPKKLFNPGVTDTRVVTGGCFTYVQFKVTQGQDTETSVASEGFEAHFSRNTQPSDPFNILYCGWNFTIQYWTSQGADRRKLVMGMPMYGQSFSLASKDENELNAPTYGGGEAGEETRARGFLAYYEICERVLKKGWELVKDSEGAIGPYARLGDQWVSFDDQAMIRHKSEFVLHNNLGGAMIWALDLDDFRNICGCEKYPLLRTINRVLRNYPGPGPDCSLDRKNILRVEALEPEIPSCTTVEKHSSDCNKFFMCHDGARMEQACPPGLHFNERQLSCDWPDKAQCVPETTSVHSRNQTSSTTIETTPVISHNTESGYKVVCYFTNWAWHRRSYGKYLPENIDSSYCTHIVYAFAALDPVKLTIKPHEQWTDIDNEFYTKVTDFKKDGVKVLLGLGGWNDSADDKYSRLVATKKDRSKFIVHLIEFIKKFDFDGIDLNWEYPKCWQVNCNRGPDSDKEGFSDLIKELNAALKPQGLLVSAAVSPSKAVIDKAYDVPTLSKYLDWIAIMTYDYHGYWDNKTGHVSPLYHHEGDNYPHFNTNYSVSYWLEQGAESRKLVLGLPLYGQSFTLANTSNTGLNAPITGPGTPGKYTESSGFMAFYEICELVSAEHWTVERIEDGSMGPVTHRRDQWVSYDDVEDIRRKTDFIKQMNLGGGTIWALDLDDFNNRCGCGKYPLLRTIHGELRNTNGSTGINCI